MLLAAGHPGAGHRPSRRGWSAAADRQGRNGGTPRRDAGHAVDGHVPWRPGGLGLELLEAVKMVKNSMFFLVHEFFYLSNISDLAQGSLVHVSFNRTLAKAK